MSDFHWFTIFLHRLKAREYDVESTSKMYTAPELSMLVCVLNKRHICVLPPIPVINTDINIFFYIINIPGSGGNGDTTLRLLDVCTRPQCSYSHVTFDHLLNNPGSTG